MASKTGLAGSSMIVSSDPERVEAETGDPVSHEQGTEQQRTTTFGSELPASTLLGVWAHPDDESYLSAALMSRVAGAGGRVVVATATRGEQGGPGDDSRRVAELRERELRMALHHLGVGELRVLGHADGRCSSEDAARATRTITDLIDEVRPDVIVTFGPDGITGHPDHRAVSGWTTAAADALGHDGLLYATMTDGFARRHAELHERLGIRMGGDPVFVAVAELALHVVPTRDERARKARALRAHASQTTPLIELIGPDAFDAWWVDEFFRRPTVAEQAAASSRLGATPWLVS